jgi:hypothetical protein
MASLADKFKKTKDLSKSFAEMPDAETGISPGAPLARALAEQPGDIVTVNDPQEGNLGRFTRSGQRLMDPQDVEANIKASMNLGGTEGLLSFLSGGGPLLDEGAGAVNAFAGRKPGEGFLDAYRRGRDVARNDVATATREASPEVMGIPVLPMLGSMAATAPIGAAGTGAKLFGAGALSSGVLGAGETEADLTRGELGPFAADVGLRSLTGGVGALAGNAIGRIPGVLASKAASVMADSAPINALKALGLRAGISNALKSLGYETPEAAKYLGQFALDKGLIESGGSADDVFAATQKALQQTGQELDPIYAAAQKASGGVDVGEAAHKATTAYTGKMLDAESRAQQGSAANAVMKILEQGELDNSFPAMRQLKTALQRGTDYRSETPLSAELRRKAVSGLRQSMEEQVSRALSPAEAARLGQLNADYGSLKDISKLALDEAQRGFGRQSAIVGGLTGALGEGAAGNPLGAAGVGAKTAAKQLIAPSRMAVWQQTLAPEVAAAAQAMRPLGGVGAAAGTGSFEPMSEEEDPQHVGYTSLISKWLKPGAPQSLVQEAQGHVDAQSRKNLVDATNGTAPQE